MRIRAGRWSLTAAAVVVVQLLTLSAVPEAAHARPATRFAAPQRERSVAGRAAVPAKRPVAGAAVPAWQPSPVHWPGAAGGDLDVRAAAPAGTVRSTVDATGTATVGGLPLALAPAPANDPSGTGDGKAAAPAASAAPDRVHVDVFDQAAARRAGLDGVLLRLSAAGPGTPAAAPGGPAPGAPGTVGVSVGYSGFRDAYGGDWSSRLALFRLPDCVLTTPARPGCADPAPLPSRNDVSTGTVSADVPSAGVFAVAATASGGAGSYSATSLSPSSSWDASEQTGDFDWTYPLRTPPVPTGDDPTVELSYSSQSVDGRTASTNNQTSWVGEGFDLVSGYIERSYEECADAGAPSGNGDECWAGDNATMMLAGQSVDLIRDDATGAWHPKQDNGDKVEELTGATNGDKYGQYWRVTTTDGTQYVFGLGHLPGWSSGKRVTNSAWTMPVYTTDKTDPCYNASFASSYCTRAWRWNLDYVVDPHGNASSYWYQPETNYYKRGYAASSGATGTLTQYVRGGYLTELDYGQTSATVFSSAPARLMFSVSERCLSTSSFNCETAANFTKANASHWPDVPFDLNCASGDACASNISPSFWSRKRLTGVTTQVLSGTAYRSVDTWTLTQSFPDPGDGTSPALWLDSIVHTGDVNGSIALPAVVFGRTQLQNRVDTIGDGLPKLDKYRIGTIDTETGGHLTVTYSDPDCGPGDKPDPATNGRRCYPVYWAGSPPQPKPFLDYFQKYVVTQVVQSDLTGGAPDEVTGYQYLDAPAWHFDDQDGLVKDKYKTWGQWRGYSRVRVVEGDPAGTQSQTDDVYLRGMDGDRSDATDATRHKTVTVTDSEGTAVTDADPLQGFQREETHLNGVGGAVVDDTIDDPWIHQTASRSRSWGTTTANVVASAATHARTALASGGWRATETDTTYTNEGLPQQVDDHGDLATTADDQCIRTTYARNDSKWMVDYVSRVETVGVSCATTPNRPADVVKDERTSYDGLAWGTAPTRGDPTKTEQIASYNGATPVYLTDSTDRYDAYGRITESDDAMGRRTTTAYTPATGGPVTASVETDNLGYASTTTFDPAWGQPVEKVDPNGKVTDLTYDALGRLTQVWLAGRARAGNPTTPNLTYSYQLNGGTAPTVVASSTLRPDLTYSTSYQLYDGLLRPRQTQEPAPGGGRVLTDTFYDSRGLVARANSDYYNSAAPGGTLFVPTAAVPGQNVTSYDGVGRAVKDSFLQNGNHLWDTTTVFGGDRVTETPPQGGTATTTVTDADGRTTQLLQYRSGSGGAADVTNYTYNPAGNLTAVTDATGRNVWTFGYNLLGQKTSQSTPDTGTTTYTYDNDDEVTSSTDARGVTLAFSYDAIGRRTGEYAGSTSGTRLAGWTYDTLAKGQLTSSTRYDDGLAYSTTISGYDDRYQPLGTVTVIPRDPGTSTAQQALAGTYTTVRDYNTSTDGTPHRSSYPAAGGLPAETVLYSYDDLGEPLTETGIDSYVSGTTYAQLGDGRITAEALGTGSAKVVRTDTYEDGTNRLLRVLDQRQASPSAVNDTRYTWDPAGNVTGISNTQQDGKVDNQCFDYDYLQRLTEAWTPSGGCQTAPAGDALAGPAAYWQSYGYDVTGNLTSRTDHAAAGDTVTTETYPAPGAAAPHTLQSLTRHAPAGDTTTSYAYDPAGNLIRASGVTGEQDFTWDAEGRLATVTKGTSVTSYRYDVDGNELIEADPSGATLYLYGMEIHADAAGTVSATRYYTFAGDTVAARTPSGLSWILTDDQNTGETQISADAAQTITRRYYTPFGDVRGVPPIGWTGQKSFVGGIGNPTTGLITLGARQYDPTAGRFISHDVITDTSDPQQLNGYAYADDTPVTKSDPSGERPGRCDAACWRIRTRLFNGSHPKSERRSAPFQSRRARAEYARDSINYVLIMARINALIIQREREQRERQAHRNESWFSRLKHNVAKHWTDYLAIAGMGVCIVASAGICAAGGLVVAAADYYVQGRKTGFFSHQALIGLGIDVTSTIGLGYVGKAVGSGWKVTAAGEREFGGAWKLFDAKSWFASPSRVGGRAGRYVGKHTGEPEHASRVVLNKVSFGNLLTNGYATAYSGAITQGINIGTNRANW